MLDAHPIRDFVAKRRFRVSEFSAGPECVAAHDAVAHMEIGDSGPTAMTTPAASPPGMKGGSGRN